MIDNAETRRAILSEDGGVLSIYAHYQIVHLRKLNPHYWPVQRSPQQRYGLHSYSRFSGLLSVRDSLNVLKSVS